MGIMGFLKKLFGKGDEAPSAPPAAQAPEAPATPPPAQPAPTTPAPSGGTV